MVTTDRADEKAKAVEDARVEAEKKQLDETVEGGRYKVGDQIVNAAGEPVKK